MLLTDPVVKADTAVAVSPTSVIGVFADDNLGTAN